MLADAKEDLIDLILVKDLSRLGRNHLLVGALIETILPEMNCRFIALPDPETVSIVKRIFHMRCMGNSFRSIAAALNQEGIPSPRTLYYQQLKKKNIFF